MTDLAIRQGRLVDPAEVSGPRIINATGLIALPGLIDLHTHLRQPGREDAETIASGTAAAARGGFTAVFAMPNTDPVTDTAERAAHIAAVGQAEGSAEVIPIGAITRGEAGQALADLTAMHDQVGTMVFSDDGRCVQNAQVMRQAFATVRAFDGLLAQHAQDDNLAGPTACCHESDYSRQLHLTGWPAQAESVIVARDVQLAELTGARLHVCHVSTIESLDVIRWAKARGVRVTAEVTPHHLLLDTSQLLRPGPTTPAGSGVAPAVPTDRLASDLSSDSVSPLQAAADAAVLPDETAVLNPTYKVNPPLRTPEHIEALRAALADGTIDIVATDHAPHTAADKNQPFELAKPGMLGLEQALSVIIETLVKPGWMDWATVAERMSYAPARLGGIADRQGRPLTIGQPANLVLVDPDRQTVVDQDASRSRSRNNPYHGWTLPDPVRLTMWQGRIMFQDLTP
jgi:dihydroorotase